MKNIGILILIVSTIFTLIGCGKYKYDLNEFNQYYNYQRTNDYSKLGNLHFSIINKNKISVNDFSGIIRTPLYLSEETFVLATSNSKILLLNQDSIIWSFELNKENALSNIVATKNKNLFFVTTDGYLYTINKDGKLINKVFINLANNQYLTVSEPLAIKSNVFLGTDDGYLFKIDTNGNILKTVQFSLSINSVFSSNGNDELYIGLTNNEYNKTDSLIILDFDLTERKRIALEGLRIIAPIVYNNNFIYLAGSKRDLQGINSDIICLNKDLETVWKANIPLICTQISVDNNNIYVGGISSGIGENLSGFFCFDLKGKEEWKNYLDVRLVSPLILGKKFMILTVSDENGSAALALSKNNGSLVKKQNLTDETPLYLIPAISYNKDVYLFGSQILTKFKITQTPLDKLLPY